MKPPLGGRPSSTVHCKSEYLFDKRHPPPGTKWSATPCYVAIVVFCISYIIGICCVLLLRESALYLVFIYCIATRMIQNCAIRIIQPTCGIWVSGTWYSSTVIPHITARTEENMIPVQLRIICWLLCCIPSSFLLVGKERHIFTVDDRLTWMSHHSAQSYLLLLFIARVSTSQLLNYCTYS